MKRIALSSILLFSLVIFFIMQYRLSPGDTPYALFGFIFLLLVSYIFVDVLPISFKFYNRIKDILFWGIITIVLGAGFSASMIVRHQTSPIYGVNDIIVQQEAAIRYFVHGKNPYQETYFGTPLANWQYSNTETNPALYHFVMEPGYLLFSLPLYTISNHLIGYFDAREMLWLLFAGMLVLAYFIPKERESRRMLVTLLAFSPATLPYVLEGRSDVFVYFFLLGTFFLLKKKRFFWAGVLLGMSFLVKQSSWPIFPLYFVYISRFIWGEKRELKDRLLFLVKNLSGFAILFLSISVPFFLWNPIAYVASTIGYLSGNVMHSYPISGYGFGMILNQIGVIKNVHQYYPFIYWQLGIALPVLCIMIWRLWKNASVQRLILFYGIFLFFFWYFSRYFNNSHVGYISMVFITAYLWSEL